MRDEDIFRREWNWMELVTKAFQLYSYNGAAIARVICLIFLPLSIVQSVIVDRMVVGAEVLNQFLQTGTLQQADVMNVLGQTLLHEVLYFAVVLFLEPVGVIAIAKLTKQSVCGEEVSVPKAISEAIQRQPQILVSGVLYGVLIGLGSFFVVPGVYLGVAWCLYLYCIGLVEDGAWQALCHSRELVRGRWWKTCGYLLVAGSIVYLWNTLFQLVFVLGGEENAFVSVLYTFLCYFSNAFFTVALTLLFLNREALVKGHILCRETVVQETEKQVAEAETNPSAEQEEPEQEPCEEPKEQTKEQRKEPTTMQEDV